MDAGKEVRGYCTGIPNKPEGVNIMRIWFARTNNLMILYNAPIIISAQPSFEKSLAF